MVLPDEQSQSVGLAAVQKSKPSGVGVGNPQTLPMLDWSQVRVEWHEPIMLRLDRKITEMVRTYLYRMGTMAVRRDKAEQLKLKNDSFRLSISKGGFLQIWPGDLKEFPLEFSRFLARCGLGRKTVREVLVRALEASKASRIAIEIPILTNALTRNLLRGASFSYAKAPRDNKTRVPLDQSRNMSAGSNRNTIRLRFDRSQNPLEAEISGDLTSLIEFLKAMGAEM